MRAFQYQLVNALFALDYSVEEVYQSLISQFDNSLTPEEARIRLHEYKANRKQRLIQVINQIIVWATRCAAEIPDGVGRVALYNLEARNALTRALPTASSQTVSNTANVLAAKLKRAPLFVELTKALNPYMTSINRDIATAGVSTNNSSPGMLWAKRGRRDLNINALTSERKYCTLCGKVGHQADDVCYAMRNDKGDIVRVVPSFTPCAICEKKNSQRLFHPQEYCPLRTGNVQKRK